MERRGPVAATFVDGMHRSFIISGVAIVSFFLVKDAVAESPADEPGPAVQDMPGVSMGIAPGE